MKKIDLLLLSTFLYLFLPIFIFCFTWIKTVYALLIFIPLIIFFVKHFSDVFYKNEMKLVKTKRDIIILVITMIILVFWLYFSGIGGFTFQNNDWDKHNALLHDLINNPWPVRYEINGDIGYLVYYFAYYIPAALVGKVFGFSVANIFLFLWTYCGLIIGLFWIYRVI